MDWVIEKASELGVDSICPFFSERTVIHAGKSDLTDRLRHWQKVAQSAAKQSDRLKPAEIDPPQAFKGLLKRLEGNEGLKAILWEAEEAEDLKGLIKKSSLAREFVGVVGPEGGFSAAEVQSATRGGFQSVSLGRRILRAETAAITLVAIVQYEWGDLRRK
jgi:16S rRNA (uracil1498-N3)-methyltransferase